MLSIRPNIYAATISFMLTLLLAGCSVQPATYGAQGESGIIRLSDVRVAQVNGSYIYNTDINRAAAEQGIVLPGEVLKPDDVAYASVLEELIDQRLLALRAKELGLQTQSEARRRLAVSEERILGNIIVEDHLAENVTEAEARKLYEAQIKLRQTGDEVRASHILVKTEEEAQSIAKAIDKAESFSKLAYDHSIDEASRSDGGDLGYFQADAMDSEFSDIAFAMAKDEVSPPFETSYGWHIIRIIDRRPTPSLSFEHMRDEILNYMTYDQIKALLDQLREQADVTLLTPDIEGVEEGGLTRVQE